MKFAFNEKIDPKDIVNIRKQLGLKQKDLAAFLNVDERTLRNWENDNKEIKGPATCLLQLLKYNPSLIQKYLIEDKGNALRLYYYHGKDLCSIIDCDYKNEIVNVKNYVDNVFYKPFGRNEKPSIKDFEEFLESRCVPKERADLKLYLKEIDVPFYDPLLIIEKTEGRCTEDDFSIKIERK